MESTNILPQGLVLMVVGMTIVFIFLYVMILVMRLTATIVPHFNHLLPTAAPVKPRTAAPASARQGGDETAIAVAIAFATDRHRRG